jgi:hypothetical protein
MSRRPVRQTLGDRARPKRRWEKENARATKRLMSKAAKPGPCGQGAEASGRMSQLAGLTAAQKKAATTGSPTAPYCRRETETVLVSLQLAMASSRALLRNQT